MKNSCKEECWQSLPLCDWDTGLTFYAWALRRDRTRKQKIGKLGFSRVHTGPVSFVTISQVPKHSKSPRKILFPFQIKALENFVKCNEERLRMFWEWQITPAEFFSGLDSRYELSLDGFHLTRLDPKTTGLTAALWIADFMFWKKPAVLVANHGAKWFDDVFRISLEPNPTILDTDCVKVTRQEAESLLKYVKRNRKCFLDHLRGKTSSMVLEKSLQNI